MKKYANAEGEALYMVMDDTHYIDPKDLPIETEEARRFREELIERVRKEFDIKPIRPKNRKKNR